MRHLDALVRAAVPGFAQLPAEAMSPIVAQLGAVTFAPQQVVVREGELGNRLFMIAEGRAEVTLEASGDSHILAVLGPRESFGEVALLNPEHRRTATVTALTSLRCYELSDEALHTILAEHPTIRAHLESCVEISALASVLKRAAPFAALDSRRVRALAACLTTQRIPAGGLIVRQHDAGDSCFILRHGQAEVLLEQPSHVVATLVPGTLFGEAALLTTSPRNATVRAVETCEILELRRDDLLAVMGTDRTVQARMMDLLRLHSRPKRRDAIVVQRQHSADGTPLTVLKEPTRPAYFRLSAHGWFLWQLLDGRHNLRDLTLAFLGKFRLFAPHVVAEIIAGLSAGGFLETTPFAPDMARWLNQHPWSVRVWRTVERILNWRVVITSVDTWVTRWYHRAVHSLFRRSSQWLLALLVAAGLVAFCAQTPQMLALMRVHTVGWGFLAILVSILLHEAGHAFTVKTCGREVLGLGIGLHWGLPILFVDTSDMWMATRWQRIAVSLAGPYTNCIVGSGAALIGWALASPIGWMTAAASYVIVLINLSPLWELDGYYALCDYFERPDLSVQRLQRREERRVAIRYLLCVMGYVLLLGAIYWSLSVR